MKGSGQVAIVTGSSRGLGAATARLLAERAYNVVVNYSKSEKGARDTQAACDALGVGTILCQADVSVDADCRRMVDQAVAKWGRVDVLVNNAGITKFCAHENLEGLTKEDFLQIYGTNREIKTVTEVMKEMVSGIEPVMNGIGKRLQNGT